jgi:hypothetical protein
MIDENAGIVILEIPSELQAEFDAWELASDEDFVLLLALLERFNRWQI